MAHELIAPVSPGDDGPATVRERGDPVWRELLCAKDPQERCRGHDHSERVSWRSRLVHRNDDADQRPIGQPAHEEIGDGGGSRANCPLDGLGMPGGR